jgi:hypothetical protein
MLLPPRLASGAYPIRRSDSGPHQIPLFPVFLCPSLLSSTSTTRLPSYGWAQNGAQAAFLPAQPSWMAGLKDDVFLTRRPGQQFVLTKEGGV